MASSGKRTKGRQKIEMKVTEKQEDKMITFSKRRSGINKKISELTTLCGTGILFICFLPTRKPYSFGQPSIKYMANRFLNNNILPSNDNTHLLVETYRQEKINQIIKYYNEVVGQLDAMEEKQKMLAQQESKRETNLWWEAPTDELNMYELEELESRYTKHLNELYNTRNKKIEATTNAKEDSL
ncbi:hypothetical protein V6N13_014136 [Hibiscus sabdariffa]|uniref:MADS-box domain-containing protein n=1 Tax=Hibiscus sabdariffa TaxID=183260 RepID=A0ABR2RUU7_9ROSI